MDYFEKYKNYHAGYVTIIGRPNCGKSTLMNTLLDFKISIVTNKPQTTRQNILGILSGDDYQIIFMDTPGLLLPRYKLHETMMTAARKAIDDADLHLFMTEADGKNKETDVSIFKKLNIDMSKAILLINKVDLVNKASVLPLIEYFHKTCKFREIFPVSALNNEGLDDLVKNIVAELPQSPPFYPEDELSTNPERFFVADIIREKIILNFSQEIPYSVTVHIEEFKEREKGKDFVQAAIFVERPTQRRIIIGKNGAALKRVGQQARDEIEKFLDREVFLKLWVGVRENWRENKNLLKEFGYLE